EDRALTILAMTIARAIADAAGGSSPRRDCSGRKRKVPLNGPTPFAKKRPCSEKKENTPPPSQHNRLKEGPQETRPKQMIDSSEISGNWSRFSPSTWTTTVSLSLPSRAPWEVT